MYGVELVSYAQADAFYYSRKVVLVDVGVAYDAAVFVSSRRPEKTGRTGKEKTSFILNADGIFLNSVFRVCFSETCGFARHSNVSLQG